MDTDTPRAIDTRDALEAIRAGHPNLSRYSSFSVKPKDVKDLTPEGVELMRADAVIQANARASALDSSASGSGSDGSRPRGWA